jgi:hypothetical protein
MRQSAAHLGVACAVCFLTFSGCSQSSNPTQPTGSTAPVDGNDLTASVTVPRALSPGVAAQIRNLDQPVTLVVANAVITQSTTVTYTFEVATDTTFANKVYSKSGVAAGANGQTSLTIDRLGPGADYYWRARAEGGGTIGPFSSARLFTIGQAIVINAPTPVSPIANTDTGSRPALIVTNATRSGPVGALTYRFEIATNAAFSPVAITVAVPEGTTRTTYQTPVDFAPEATIFWRATAIDQSNGVTGPTSAPASFVTSLTIDLTRVTYLNGPNVSNWPQTANLILVEQDGGGEGPVCMQFTDPGWPDSPWPYGGDDPNFGVYANQWYFAKIGGRWYGGAGEWIYRGGGSCKAGQGTRTIGPDSGFGPPFSTWVPQVGELVGFMVSSVARAGAVRRTVDQRSNVIVQPWRDTSLGSRSIGRTR